MCAGLEKKGLTSNRYRNKGKRFGLLRFNLNFEIYNLKLYIGLEKGLT